MLTADQPSLAGAPPDVQPERGHLALRRLPLLLVLPILGACFTANPMLTVLCIVVATLLPLILWRAGEPPVLLFCLAVQLLQVSTVLLYADFAQANLVAAFGGSELQMAVGLGLVGLVVLALGVRVGMGRRKREISDQAESEALQIPVPTALALYLASFAASSILRMIAGRFSGVIATTNPRF